MTGEVSDLYPDALAGYRAAIKGDTKTYLRTLNAAYLRGSAAVLDSIIDGAEKVRARGPITAEDVLAGIAMVRANIEEKLRDA
jgi:hypothetical protein